MKKIICIIFSIVMILSIMNVVSAENAGINADLLITSEPMELNLTDTGEFNVSYRIDNKSLADRITATAEYTLVDEDENLLWSGESDIRVSPGGTKNFEFTGSVSKYGVHTLRINIKDKNTGKVLKGATSVSLSKSNIRRNDIAGVSAHFAWNSNPNSTIPYLANIGSRFVRDEIYWKGYEIEDGVYELSEKADDYINKVLENGLEPLIILNYSATANGEIPVNDTEKFREFVEGFGEYVYHLVSDLKGRVTYFEVWNELNTIDNGAHGDKYTELLKVAYNKAKMANPDCKIIGPVTAGTSTKFFLAMKMKDANIANYMDILSFHEYGYSNAPESAAYEDVLKSCRNKLKSNFGSDKEVWLTEMGWSEGSDGIDERTSAMYTVRQYLNNDSEKFADKMFVYTWINQAGHHDAHVSNLGILKDDLSAKKTYPAMAAMNSFLTGFTLKDRSEDSNGNYIYNYRNQSGDEVIVVYNMNDETKTVSVNTSSDTSTLYDMYGNKIKDLSGAEAYNISVNGAPKYIVSKKAPARMDYKTNTAEISGQIEGVSVGESIMLYVTKPGIGKNDVLSKDSLVYVEQLKLGADGTYEFKFPMNKGAGKYNVYVGYGKNSTLSGPVVLEVVRDVTGYTGVYNTDGEMTTVQDIKNSVSEVWAKGMVDNRYNTDLKAILYAAGIKDNHVLWVKSEDKEISVYGEHTLEIAFDKQLVMDTDEIKLYLWSEDMNPFAGEVTEIEQERK